MAFANFMYRGKEYTVCGHISPRFDDRAGDGIIVDRADGTRPRGSKMHPGMVQTGLSRSLERAAERAIEAAQEAERRRNR